MTLLICSPVSSQPDMRNTFIVTNMFILCTVMAPILWHLWIYAGSANANFYFAMALTFSTAQVTKDKG